MATEELKYDHRNRLTKATLYSNCPPPSAGENPPVTAKLFSVIEYQYDVLGNRIAKTAYQAHEGGTLTTHRKECYGGEWGQRIGWSGRDRPPRGSSRPGGPGRLARPCRAATDNAALTRAGKPRVSPWAGTADLNGRPAIRTLVLFLGQPLG